jgi:hypothetical protein
MDETSKNMKQFNTMRPNPHKVDEYVDDSYHDLSYNKTFDLFTGINDVGVKQGIERSISVKL